MCEDSKYLEDLVRLYQIAPLQTAPGPKQDRSVPD